MAYLEMGYDAANGTWNTPWWNEADVLTRDAKAARHAHTFIADPWDHRSPRRGSGVTKNPNYKWQESDFKNDMRIDLQYKHGGLMAGVNGVDLQGWGRRQRRPLC